MSSDLAVDTFVSLLQYSLERKQAEMAPPLSNCDIGQLPFGYNVIVPPYGQQRPSDWGFVWLCSKCESPAAFVPMKAALGNRMLATNAIQLNVMAGMAQIAARGYPVFRHSSTSSDTTTRLRPSRLARYSASSAWMSNLRNS